MKLKESIDIRLHSSYGVVFNFKYGALMLERLKLFFNVFDSRFEDLTPENWKTTIYRDFSAGLITALTAIPMAMGFAMASGLRPEQGIIAGALACLIGRTFGGSKYQVYGPTAAFIPVIHSVVQSYGHGYLVFVSILSGVVLVSFGLLGLGKVAKWVPNSIVVGFTIGIAVSIAVSHLGDMLGLHGIKGDFFGKIALISERIGEVNGYALILALLTFILSKGLLKISIFIPAPFIAIAVATGLGTTWFAGHDIVTVGDKYGAIPKYFFTFTPPILPEMSSQVVFDTLYFVFAIVFVSAVESLLCSSMADRLAGNKKTPFHPDKELWGQGLVQIFTPLFNGFPCTGALARTATSIQAGAVTPLAGYFKSALKLGLAFFVAPYLEHVPMACVGGILAWVASNMIKGKEIREVRAQGKLEIATLIYTAITVPATDFLTGVLSALILYFIAKKFFKPALPQVSIGH